MQKAPAPHMKTRLLKTGQECRVTREGKKLGKSPSYKDLKVRGRY